MSEHLRREMLHRYLDGDLTWQEREQVRQHLDMCSTCAREMESLRRAEYALRQMARFTVPREFTQRVMAQVRASATPAASPTVVWAGRTAMLAGLLLLALSLVEAWSSVMTGITAFSGNAVDLLTDPVLLLEVLVSGSSGLGSGLVGLGETAVPLGLALLALGAFAQALRWLGNIAVEMEMTPQNGT